MWLGLLVATSWSGGKADILGFWCLASVYFSSLLIIEAIALKFQWYFLFQNIVEQFKELQPMVALTKPSVLFTDPQPSTSRSALTITPVRPPTVTPSPLAATPVRPTPVFLAPAPPNATVVPVPSGSGMRFVYCYTAQNDPPRIIRTVNPQVLSNLQSRYNFHCNCYF